MRCSTGILTSLIRSPLKALLARCKFSAWPCQFDKRSIPFPPELLTKICSSVRFLRQFQSRLCSTIDPYMIDLGIGTHPVKRDSVKNSSVFLGSPPHVLFSGTSNSPKCRWSDFRHRSSRLVESV